MSKVQYSPRYGNWVSDKRIRQTFMMFLVFALIAAALAAFAAPWGAIAIVLEGILTLLAVLFLIAAVYFVRAKRMFSDEGDGVQRKIQRLVTEHVRWDGCGCALDIGCGSGALAIMLAKAYPETQITGTDYWGGSWGYGQKQCEDNARMEGVAEQMRFVQASASSLPFEDGEFDLAVSNLVFHEVRDSKDKRDAIHDALRVVKKGGHFVFQDLFQLTPYFGTTEELLAFIRGCDIDEVYFEDTSKSAFIPRALKLPFMVGTLGMVYGVK